MARKFVTPPLIPGGFVSRVFSIPNSKEWLGVFSGALSETIYPHNYEQVDAASLTPDQAAEQALATYTAWLEAGEAITECPPPTFTLPDDTPSKIYRRNPTTGNWEFLDETGAWVEPTGDETIPPGDARTESTTTDRTCAAATNAAEVMRDLYGTVIQGIQDDLTDAQIAVEIIGFVTGTVSAVLGGPTTAAIWIDTGAFLGLISVARAILSDFWDDRFHNEYICCLKTHATDTAGVVTFDLPAVNECVVNTAWADPRSALLAAEVVYLHSIIGAQGLSIAGGTTAVTGNCIHCGEWARDFDFRLGVCGWGTTTAGDAGTWQTAGYWFSTTAAGPTLILTCNPPIDTGFAITRIVVDYEMSPLPSGFADQIMLASHSPSRSVNLTNSPGRHVFDTGYTLNWTNQGDVAFRFFKSGTDGSRCKLHRVRYYGTGTMPFSDLQGVNWYGA